LQQNIALAMVDIDSSQIGCELMVHMPAGPVQAVVVDRPFFDPKKKIASAA